MTARRSRRFLVLAAGLPLAGSLLALGPRDLAPVPEGVDAREVAERVSDALGGDRSVVEAVMTVVGPRGSEPRVVRFQRYHDCRRRRSFVRVLAPERDAGTSFLMLEPNLWVHVPSADRTVLVAPPTVAESWLGGGFTHADLLRVWSELEDYDHRLLGVETRVDGVPGSRFYVLESTPGPGLRAAWRRILTWVDAESGIPLRREYYADGEAPRRVLRFSDVRRVGDRAVPHRWVLTDEDADGRERETRIEIESIELDATFDDTVFTTSHLAEAD